MRLPGGVVALVLASAVAGCLVVGTPQSETLSEASPGTVLEQTYTGEITETEDGRLSLTFEAPETGGWYFIVFHTAGDRPGVNQVTDAATVTKHDGAPGTAS